MKVEEIMTRSVVSLSPKMPLREAAILMKEENIGMIPVAVEGFLTGVVTDRDIALRCVANGADADTLSVSDVATKGAVWISPMHSVTEAARVMAREQVRRLPVCKEGRLVGILSLSDIARAKPFFAEAAAAFCDICR